MKRLIAVTMLVLMMGGVLGACSYGAVAVSQSGTIYVARNDNFLFGALRKMYSCKDGGTALTCIALEGKP